MPSVDRSQPDVVSVVIPPDANSSTRVSDYLDREVPRRLRGAKVAVDSGGVAFESKVYTTIAAEVARRGGSDVSFENPVPNSEDIEKIRRYWNSYRRDGAVSVPTQFERVLVTAERFGFDRERRDDRAVDRLTALGGYGWAFEPGEACVLVVTDTGVTVGSRDGDDSVGFGWEDIVEAHIFGPGEEVQGGGVIGGGVGLEGIVVGVALAGVLNALTTTTTVNTFLRVTTFDGECTFHTDQVGPDALRLVLSPLFGRLLAREARRRSPQVQRDGVAAASRHDIPDARFDG